MNNHLICFLPISTMLLISLLIACFSKKGFPVIYSLGFFINSCFLYSVKFSDAKILNYSEFNHNALLIVSVISCIYFLFKSYSDSKNNNKEADFLILSSILGGSLMILSTDFILLFIGLELLSIPLYFLSSFDLNIKESAGGGVKYFISGSFFSALFLLGVCLLFLTEGSFSYFDFYGKNSFNLKVGSLIIVLSLFFKLGLVPFHYFYTEIYKGAPSFVSIFFASIVKILVAISLYNLIKIPFSGMSNEYIPIFWIIGFLSILIGSLLTFIAVNIKIKLASFLIAMSSFIIFIYLSIDPFSGDNLLYYLLVYGVSSILVFDIGYSHKLKGLYSVCKTRAVLFSLAILTILGFPPILSGLFAKILIIKNALISNYFGLVLLYIVGLGISFYAILQVLSQIFLYESADDEGLKTNKNSTLFVLYLPILVLIIISFVDILISY